MVVKNFSCHKKQLSSQKHNTDVGKFDEINSSKYLSLNTKNKYIILVCSIILLLVVTQVIIQYSISVQKHDSHLINLSGQQRMLSQNISKKALLVFHQKDNFAHLQTHQKELNQLAQQFKEVHLGLLTRDSNLGLGGENSIVIKQKLEDIEPYFTALLENATALTNVSKKDNLQPFVDEIMKNEHLFLVQMNAIVNQYDKEATQRVASLQRIEIILGVTTFIVLILEILLIFMPLIKSLVQRTKEVEQSNLNLQKRNEELTLSKQKIKQQNTEILEKNEELFLAKQTAEAAAISKANFLSNMSHEIRTPMNGVLGITNILMEENPTETQRKHLGLLKYSAENLLNIINDILDYGKIESGKLRLEKETFDIHQTLNNIKELLVHKSDEKNIDFVLDTDLDLPRFIQGDPYRLNQILINLVGNAIKFTKKGSVTLTTKIIGEQADDLLLFFAVKDTGIGIPKDKQKLIFENFTQANDSTNRVYGGTGLGLAISKKLLELMGGKIELQSELGKGSKFSFALRLGKAKQATIQKDTLLPIKERTLHYKGIKKILLVDDNMLNLSVGQRFLNYWDLECDIAKNGQEALEMVIQNEYELILMDLQMPVMDGFTAVQEIRLLEGAKYKSENLPIIALTASAVAEVRDRVAKVGMNDFLLKPYKPQELYEILEKHIASRLA